MFFNYCAHFENLHILINRIITVQVVMTSIANRQNVKKRKKKKHVFLGSLCLQFLIICERRLFGFFSQNHKPSCDNLRFYTACRIRPYASVGAMTTDDDRIDIKYNHLFLSDLYCGNIEQKFYSPYAYSIFSVS